MNGQPGFVDDVQHSTIHPPGRCFRAHQKNSRVCAVCGVQCRLHHRTQYGDSVCWYCTESIERNWPGEIVFH